MIAAQDVVVRYGARVVLHGVDLRADTGRVLGLVGPNGSGKTTLLRRLHGALNGSEGTVLVDGQDVAAQRPRELARRLAVVVQEQVGESTTTVAETVLLGRSPRLGTFRRTGPRDHEVAAACLARVGADHLATRSFDALSGGERQRVLIARALAQEASHLLLDEPTNHLDVRYQHEVLQLVRAIGTTTVVVLHDLNLAARYCDDVVLLQEGRVVASGPTSSVLDADLLAQVYELGVRRLDLDDGIHLLFRPTSSQPGRSASTDQSAFRSGRDDL